MVILIVNVNNNSKGQPKVAYKIPQTPHIIFPKCRTKNSSNAAKE